MNVERFEKGERGEIGETKLVAGEVRHGKSRDGALKSGAGATYGGLDGEGLLRQPRFGALLDLFVLGLYLSD